MNMIECKKYSNDFNKGSEIEEIINNQIDTYFDIVDSNYQIKRKEYKKGDKVLLTKDNFLHGIGTNMNAIDIIASNGVISKEATGDFGNHAFQFVIGLWRVKENIMLDEYIKNYSGMVVNYEDVVKQVPYKGLDDFVEEMKEVDHWLWKAESSIEIRFMPSLARNINQVGFIFDIDERGKKLLENDINSKEYNKDISVNFLREGMTKEFFLDKNNTFLERASYVIFGIPNNFIEGIIVGRDLEKNIDELDKLKKLFPKCYICNLDGIVIVN